MGSNQSQLAVYKNSNHIQKYTNGILNSGRFVSRLGAIPFIVILVILILGCVLCPVFCLGLAREQRSHASPPQICSFDSSKPMKLYLSK